MHTVIQASLSSLSAFLISSCTDSNEFHVRVVEKNRKASSRYLEEARELDIRTSIEESTHQGDSLFEKRCRRVDLSSLRHFLKRGLLRTHQHRLLRCPLQVFKVSLSIQSIKPTRKLECAYRIRTEFVNLMGDHINLNIIYDLL